MKTDSGSGRKRGAIHLALAVLLCVLAGCRRGTSGSASGSSIQCAREVGEGWCRGSYREISGTYSEEIEIVLLAPAEVTVDVNASVGEGRMRVYFLGAGGAETSAEAAVGQPAQLSGTAQVNYDNFSIYFEVLEEPVSGVSFDVTYSTSSSNSE